MIPVDDSVTRYTLAIHPRNRAIVDIRNKSTNELQFIKIRHRLANFYAVSLIDPKTFDVWAETQVKSAGTRLKPITLQGYKDSVLLKDTSLFGFEWSFEWENQKYKWVRESPIRPSLECKAVLSGRASDRCVARYLPRGVKDEYFGLVTILDRPLAQLEDERAMELLLITSLMTILDKANDNSWKKEKSSGALFLEPNEIPSIHHHPDIYGSGGAKNKYDDIDGTDSDDEDDDSGNCNNNNNNDGKQYDRLVDHDRGEKASPSQKQQQQNTAPTKSISNEARSNDGDNEDGYASQQQAPYSGGSSPTHDLRSHQRQQAKYISHMLSTMKHSGNATATLPSSFVQHTTTIDTTATTKMGDGFGDVRRSLQTLWRQNNYRNTNIKNNNNNNSYQHNRYDDMEEEQVILHSSSSRHYNNHHHRTRSHRRLSSTDDPPSLRVPFSRQPMPPPLPPALSFRNSVSLHHPIPGPHRQYYLQ